ncbi:MAG: hypothetical protein ACOC1U_02740 [Spirochaetota bacterium]
MSLQFRSAAARALAGRPSVLLVDDPEFQTTLRKLREDLHNYEGRPVIYQDRA